MRVGNVVAYVRVSLTDIEDAKHMAMLQVDLIKKAA